MKTIEEAARDYSIHEYWGICEIADCDGLIDKSEEDFKAGAEFAQQMISFDEEKPEYYTPVIIEYESNEYIAWLAWSETGGYIWTINGTDLVLMYKPNVKWRHINIK